MFKPAFVAHRVNRDIVYFREVCTVFEVNPGEFRASYSLEYPPFDHAVKSANFDTIEEAFAWCVEQFPQVFE